MSPKDSVDSEILMGTLQVYADGSYQVELWCPVGAAVTLLAQAVEDLHDNSEEAQKETRRLGYES